MVQVMCQPRNEPSFFAKTKSDQDTSLHYGFSLDKICGVKKINMGHLTCTFTIFFSFFVIQTKS